MAIWRRYLFAGLGVSAVCVALPLGVGRDLLYCLIGFSGAAAILFGISRNRPAHPAGWYLIAAGTLVWVLGDALYGWYEHVALIEPFPSPADALYLPAYGLFAAGLLMLVQSHSPERGPNTLLDTAILTVGLGLPVWLFLVTPAWSGSGEPMLNRLVGVAYPFCDLLLFAMLMRLATSINHASLHSAWSPARSRRRWPPTAYSRSLRSCPPSPTRRICSTSCGWLPTFCGVRQPCTHP